MVEENPRTATEELKKKLQRKRNRTKAEPPKPNSIIEGDDGVEEKQELEEAGNKASGDGNKGRKKKAKKKMKTQLSNGGGGEGVNGVKEEEGGEEGEQEKKVLQVTNDGLQAGYCVVPSAKRFLLLSSFLKKNLSKKVMVFFSSCNSVKYHSELLRHIHLECFDIHEKQKQQRQTSTFFDFCKAEKGILFCTDVAARGLDIQAVDWIVQYDPPEDPRDYIDRVGPTARGKGWKGNALLFLIPEELKFLRFLKKANVPLKEYEFNQKKLANVQSHLEKLVAKNYYLSKSAKDAYRAYILAYNSHSMKDIFNVHRLDLQAVAASFFFSSPPKINFE